jgi:urea carboxylase-associated protein 1
MTVPVTNTLTTSIISDDIVAACAPWSAILRPGQQLQIIDLHGNQAVDTLFYGVHPATAQVDPTKRYSFQATIAAQGKLFLTTGSVLRSADGTALVTIVDDEVGNHDTIAGACSKESNTLRYGHHTMHQHACAENFLAEASKYGMGKRDIVPNVNFFMNVPVEADGTLGIVDGLSAPGKSLTVRAETDTLVLVSNCPQINNPCNGFDPTPVRMVITTA